MTMKQELLQDSEANRNQTLPFYIYSETCLKRSLSKRPKKGFQGQLSHNAGHKYCRML